MDTKLLPTKKILKVNVMYELYVKELKDKQLSLLLSIQNLEEQQEKLIKWLGRSKILINQTYDKSFEELIKLKTITEFKAIYTTNTDMMVVIYFERLIKLNAKIPVLKSTLNGLNKAIVSEKLYTEIIKRFNSKVVDKIVFNNYFFFPSHTFGAIGIVQSNHKRIQIDWSKSKKKKKRLEEAGITPYYKEEELAAAKKGEEYNGVPWLVERPQLNYFFHWFKFKLMKKINPLVKDYRFQPAKGKLKCKKNPEMFDNPVGKLQYVKCDPVKASTLYTRVLNYVKDPVNELS